MIDDRRAHLSHAFQQIGIAAAHFAVACRHLAQALSPQQDDEPSTRELDEDSN